MSCGLFERPFYSASSQSTHQCDKQPLFQTLGSPLRFDLCPIFRPSRDCVTPSAILLRPLTKIQEIS